MLRKVEGGTLGKPETVHQNYSPTTVAGIETVVARLAGDEYERFKRLSAQRAWSHGSIPTLQGEMAALAPRLCGDLGPSVLELLKGSLAVERHTDQFIEAGVRASGNRAASIDFYKNYWGPQEDNHAKALEMCLRESGLMTRSEVRSFSNECAESKPWTFEDQIGYSGKGKKLVWGLAYATAQEEQTKFTYIMIEEVVWEQYGSPRDPKDGRKLHPGLCGVLKLISKDEGAHRAFFLRMLLIWLRYRPDETLEALAGTFRGYRMPKVHIPNEAAFIEAMILAKINDPRWIISKVLTPVGKSLGFENRAAMLRAMLNFSKFLDNEPNKPAVLRFPGEKIEVPPGCVELEMQPNGTFTPVETAA
ncbi:hypothetical protein IID23_04560 [Patescibacteria group bacterium]|nr:hypothetical protein [Patescibacteria group bacterium]